MGVPSLVKRELDLARKSRLIGEMRQLLQQLAFIRLRRGQLFGPGRIHIDVAGGAGAHPPADRRHAIFELAQRFHDLQSGAGLHFMLDTVTVNHLQQRHSLALLPQKQVRHRDFFAGLSGPAR